MCLMRLSQLPSSLRKLNPKGSAVYSKRFSFPSLLLLPVPLLQKDHLKQRNKTILFESLCVFLLNTLEQTLYSFLIMNAIRIFFVISSHTLDLFNFLLLELLDAQSFWFELLQKGMWSGIKNDVLEKIRVLMLLDVSSRWRKYR